METVSYPSGWFEPQNYLEHHDDCGMKICTCEELREIDRIVAEEDRHDQRQDR